MRNHSFVIAILLCSCAFTTRVFPQARNDWPKGQGRGVVIEGLIQSAFKVPIPKLDVTLRNTSDGKLATGTSNAAGEFQFVAPEGEYVLSTVLGRETVTRKLRVTARQRLAILTIPVTKRVHCDDRSAISVSQLKIPKEARRAEQKGIEASAKNNTAQAIEYMTKAINLYPRYAEAFALRGAMERETDLRQSLIDAQRAVENDPNLGMGYVTLGSVYTAYGRFDDALRTLNHAIAIQPDFWQAHYEMTRALVGKEDYNTALTNLQTTCNLIPTNHPFMHLLKADVFIGLKDASSAARELVAYLQEAPGSPESARATMTLAHLQAVTSQAFTSAPIEQQRGHLRPRSD